MNREQQPTKRLPRPDLRVNPNKWSSAQGSSIAARIAVIATISAIIGGMGLVFLYPYFNIDRFRKSNSIKNISNLFIILGKIQKANRAGINPEDVQPTGNKYFLSSILMLFRDLYPIGLPVWRDPFDRKKAG
jgi:hypothetical protein